jgi:hypothetical protein
MKFILMPAIMLCALSRCLYAADEPAPELLSLEPTKDVRIFFDVNEQDLNGGQSTRLRARSLGGYCDEAILMDFDHQAIADFVSKNKDKTVTGSLSLFALGVEGDTKVTVEISAFDTASDWAEGDKTGDAASAGDVTFLCASHPQGKWKGADDKPIANFAHVFLDASGSPKALLNSSSLTVDQSQKDTQVSVTLDAKFVKHLATVQTSKGLVIFTRKENVKVDFASKEQDRQHPKLVLTAAR